MFFLVAGIRSPHVCHDQFSKVVSVVLRIFPTSTLAESSRLFRDILLSILYRLNEDFVQSSKSGVDTSKVESPYYETFFDKLLLKMNVKSKNPYFKRSQSSNRSEWPTPGIVNMGFLELLGMLAANVTTISGDLDKFMDFMKVTNNEEVVSVHECLSLFDDDLKASYYLAEDCG